LGRVARFEELSRCATETQDVLISILSEKCIAVPELSSEQRARHGFSLIATANSRDKGTSEMSSALARRFNTVILPAPATPELELEIVTRRVAQLGIPALPPESDCVEKVVTVLRELRQGKTLDGSDAVKTPSSSSCSTADAISLLGGSMALAASFGGGVVTNEHIAVCLAGAIAEEDSAVWAEYTENILRKRAGGWRELYSHIRELLP
jgi:MoxR-like ATPase